MGSHWGLTPRQSIEAECRRRGRDAVVDGCVRLLETGTLDAPLLLALSGPGGQMFLDGEEHADTYWLRVWSLRGLLWVWDERATAAVVAAVDDEHWRAREMALKVVARHRVDDALDAAAARRDDPVERVRQSAERALLRLTTG
jgi:hypothetical protein